MPTLYLAQHYTGIISIVLYGIWCKLNSVHLFHSTKNIWLRKYLGKLSILKRSSDNTEYIRSLLQNKEVERLMIFGHKNSKLYIHKRTSHFGHGLFTITNMEYVETRVCLLDPRKMFHMIISEPIKNANLSVVCAVLNKMQNTMLFKVTDDDKIDVCGVVEHYVKHDVMIITVLSIIVSTIVLIIMLLILYYVFMRRKHNSINCLSLKPDYVP